MVKTRGKSMLLLDGSRGIYIPYIFASGFNLESWNIAIENYQELLDPEHEDYWDAWDDLLAEAFHIDKEGNRWKLYQDDSLFAITV